MRKRKPRSSARQAAAAASICATAKRLCSYCRSAEAARSHRRGRIEKYLVRAIYVRVYRGEDGHSGFYGFAHSDAKIPPKNQAALPWRKTRHRAAIE